MYFFFSKLFELHSRGRKKSSDHFENIRVTTRGVVESRRVNQNDTTAIEIKSTRRLDGVCAGS